VGQRFRKRNAGVWEVVALTRDELGKAHVRLRGVTDPNSQKTLAVAALSDPTEFVPEPKGPPHRAE